MIFVLIDFLFIGLSLSTLGVMPHAMHNLAAYSELLISLLSFYGSAAAVLNTSEKLFYQLENRLVFLK